MNLPEVFAEKMRGILGEEYGDFAAGFDKPRHYGLRVNTGKISPEHFMEIAPFHLTRIPWTDNGFYYEEEDAPSRHPYYYAGLYYIQEPSAMTPASRLLVEPGERVLDLCAAPGGKATELGAKLGGSGVLVANDISASRTKALLKNVELMGISNAFLLNEVPAKIAGQFPEYFDKILVDAPCSGEGMFRKNPEAARAWDEQKPLECAKMQREILKQAVTMLKDGGMLLYSTCTFSPEENEQMMAWLMKEYPEMHLLEMEGYEGFSKGRPELADGNPELEKCVRIWPHRMDGEGHFVALLQKGDSVPAKQETNSSGKKYMTKQERMILDAFFADVKKEFDWNRIQVRKGKVYYVPEGLEEQKGLVFVRNGLYLGELKKDRFEPSQAFAMALKKEEYAYAVDFSASDARVLKYLKGETVETDDLVSPKQKGWQLVCVDGYPLGWGKLVNGTLKNKYLAGWRI